MIKNIVLLISIIISTLFLCSASSNSVEVSGAEKTDAAYTTTNFVLTDDCFLNQTTQTGGCNIFGNASYWDVPDALTNSVNYTFRIDLTATTQVVNLIISNITQFDLEGLLIYGGQSTQLTVDVSVLNVTANVTFNNVNIEMVNTSIIYADQVYFTNTTSCHLAQQSKFYTYVYNSDNSMTIDSTSSITMYDNAALTASLLVANGNINCHDQSQLIVNNATFYNLFVGINGTVHTTTIIHLYGTNSIINGAILGSSLFVHDNANITSNGGSFNTTILQFGNNAELIVENGESFVDTLILPQSGVFALFNSTFVLSAESGQPQTIDGFLVLTGTTNITLTNVTLSNILTDSMKHPQGGIYSTITLAGANSFVNTMQLNSHLVIAPQSSLIILDELQLYMGVDNYGSVFLQDRLVCNNAKFNLPLPASQLQLNNGAVLWAYQMDNNGVINSNTLASIHANVNNSGTISMQPDCTLSIVGYLDLFEGSLINIGGIGPNTSYAALGVLNEVRAEGELQFNVSVPPEYGVSGYNLISTQIGITGDFNLTNIDPSLDSYEFTIYQYPQSLQAIYFGKEKPSEHHSPALPILLSIFLPLLALTIVFTILLYIYRRNKQYKFYTRIQ